MCWGENELWIGPASNSSGIIRWKKDVLHNLIPQCVEFRMLGSRDDGVVPGNKEM